MTGLGAKLGWTLILGGGALAALANAAWVLHYARDVSLMPDQHFPLVGWVWGLDKRFAVPGSLAVPFYWIAALTGALSGSVAVALALRRIGSRYALDLAAALASGSAAAAWFLVIRVFDEFHVAQQLDRWWVWTLDIAATTIWCFGSVRFVAFIARFPTQVTLDDLWGIPQKATDPRSWSGRVDRLMYAYPKWVQQRAIYWSRRWGMRGVAKWFLYQHSISKARLGKVLSKTDRERLANVAQHVDGWAAGTTASVAFVVLGVVAGAAWRGNAPEKIQFLTLAGPMSFAAILIVIGWYSMLEKYRHALPDQRRQIEWILWGTMSGLALVALAFFGVSIAVPVAAIFGWLEGVEAERVLRWHQSFLALSVVTMAGLIVLGIAFSIFYHGAINPGLAIRRTAIYGLLGLVLTTVFVAVEGTVSSAIVIRMGLPAGTAPAVAGTVVALAFGPARKRVEARI